MTKQPSDIELIKNEIKRREEGYRERFIETLDDYYLGVANALKLLWDYVDSFPQKKEAQPRSHAPKLTSRILCRIFHKDKEL